MNFTEDCAFLDGWHRPASEAPYQPSELSSRMCFLLKFTFVHKCGLVTGTFLLQLSSPCRQVQLCNPSLPNPIPSTSQGSGYRPI
eukprot:1143701-Pelagomonas_calceolata.AAC.5